MGCCGKGRVRLTTSNRAMNEQSVRGASLPSRVRPRVDTFNAAVFLEYVGATGLTVRGPISGKTYRFVRPGASVAVDGLDAPYLLAVPNLRKHASVPPL